VEFKKAISKLRFFSETMIGSKSLLVFLFFLIFTPANAQVNYPFVKHLSEHNLSKEHLSYITQLSGKSTEDSVNYLKAKYYLQYVNDSLFLNFYFKSKSLFISDNNAFVAASIHFLTRDTALQKVWYNSVPTSTGSKKVEQINTCYSASVYPTKTDGSILPVALQSDFARYQRSQSKKPWAAAALSAAVPGLGKMYAGRKRSSVFTFLSQLTYGVQSYESIKKLGVSHPFSIFSLSLFGVFYAANIYGSYQDVRKVKKETKTQFLINAQKYYHFNFGTPLY
jgi:hypothetical protein